MPNLLSMPFQIPVECAAHERDRVGALLLDFGQKLQAAASHPGDVEMMDVAGRARALVERHPPSMRLLAHWGVDLKQDLDQLAARFDLI